LFLQFMFEFHTLAQNDPMTVGRNDAAVQT
jgi:hypothetical protein